MQKNLLPNRRATCIMNLTELQLSCQSYNVHYNNLKNTFFSCQVHWWTFSMVIFRRRVNLYYQLAQRSSKIVDLWTVLPPRALYAFVLRPSSFWWSQNESENLSASCDLGTSGKLVFVAAALGNSLCVSDLSQLLRKNRKLLLAPEIAPFRRNFIETKVFFKELTSVELGFLSGCSSFAFCKYADLISS